MANNSSREFAFYNLRFSATSAKYKTLQAYPMAKHLEWLRSAFHEKSTFIFANKKKAYYIQDWDECSTHILMLVKFIDGQSRDHTLEDMQTRVSTTIAKSDSQGDSYTSHIYISKVPDNSAYRMIVEVNHGFTLGNLSNMLTGILKVYLKKHLLLVKLPDPNGAKKDNKDIIIKKWPVALARGTLAESFSNEINGANITDIELITYESEQVHLEGTRMHVKKSVVQLQVDDGGLMGNAIAVLRRLAGLNRDRFSEIAVTYKQDDTKPLRARLECDAALNPIDADRLIKKIVVENWAARINQAYDVIQHEVKSVIESHKND